MSLREQFRRPDRKRSLSIVIPLLAVLAAVVFAPAALSATHHSRRHTHARRHHRTHARTSGTRRALAAPSNNTNCTGVQSKNVPNDLTVPSNATCTILHGVTIGDNLIVDKGATLIDQGAKVNDYVTATSPKSIGIGGGGTISNSVTINGLTGAGPGTGGSNYICNTRIGNSLTVENTTATAGEWVIGDMDEGCSAGADQIGNNLVATNNIVRVDISDNKFGTPPYSIGIADNLTVTGNLVNSTSPVVESNFVGGIATCQAGTKTDGDGTKNIVDGANHGCP